MDFAGRNMMRFWRLVVFSVAFVVLPAMAQTLQPLDIQTAHGSFTFNVELARTDQEVTHGLMDRRSLAKNSGMLFIFQKEQPVAFWMKNTLIPLDMLFIAGDGTIRGIAKQAKPLSLDNIRAPGSVRAVLEVNGGIADQLGIDVGDKVISPFFEN
jgi:uncharacterized protein